MSFKNFQEFKKRYPIKITEDTLLGSGTYGRVVMVEDQVETEWVAIKISEYKGEDAKSLKAEVELAQKVPRHANIARYDACFRIETDMGLSDFAIMKYYSDGNLAQLMQTVTLNSRQIDELVRGILHGLEHLHINRIVHRDFKPANILISRDNKGRLIPKIADFGLSKLVKDDEIDSSDFDLSDGRGTPSYKAPEQIEGGRVSFNLDLWAFGVILYELILGERPFKVETKSSSEQITKREIERKILAVEIPANINKIPEPYLAIVKRCLIKDIHLRVRKESELFDLLDGISQLFDQAKQQFIAKKYQESIKLYELILDKREGNEAALQGIKKCKTAIEDAQITQWLEEAETFLSQKQWDNTLDRCEQILAKRPGDLSAKKLKTGAQEAISKEKRIKELNRQAQEVFDQKDYIKAKAISQELLIIAPNHSQAQQLIVQCNDRIIAQQIDQLFEIAHALFERKQYEASIVKYKEVLSIDPKNTQAQKQITACEEGKKQVQIDKLLTDAKALAQKKQYDTAIIKYSEILVIAPAHNEAKAQIKICEEAIKQIKIQKLYDEAQNLVQKKQHETAIEKYRSVLNIEPTHFQAKAQIKICEEAIKQAKIQQWLSDADKAVGKKKWIEAQNLYQQILTIDTSHNAAQQGIAKCIEALTAIEEKTDTYIEEKTDVYVPLPLKSLPPSPKRVIEPKVVVPPTPKPENKDWVRRALPYAIGAMLLGGGGVWYMIHPKTEIVSNQETKIEPEQAETTYPEPIKNTKAESVNSKTTKVAAKKEENKPIIEKPAISENPKTDNNQVQIKNLLALSTNALQNQNWPKAISLANEALRLENNSREAKRIKIEATRQQQIALDKEKEQNSANKIKLYQGQYDDFVTKGMAAITKNDKTTAANFFTQANAILNQNEGVSPEKGKEAYNACIAKGDKFYALEEYEGAKAWYKVAQSLRSTPQVQQKIKECDTNL